MDQLVVLYFWGKGYSKVRKGSRYLDLRLLHLSLSPAKGWRWDGGGLFLIAGTMEFGTSAARVLETSLTVGAKSKLSQQYCVKF